MADVEPLTLETFTPHVGEDFLVHLDEQTTISLVLASADALPPPPGDMGRPPFSLIFHGPVQPVIAQATIELNHAWLGALHIFVVPIGQTAEHTRYEAIFT